MEDTVRRRHLPCAFAVLLLLWAAGPALSQTQPTGEIFGRVTDTTGAVLPGVSVTISGPALLQPQSMPTTETGAYVFTRLPIGTYTVKFDLAGFKTEVFEEIRVTIGFRAQVNARLEPSTVQETITVTGESPIVDTRQTGTQTTFTQETLQTIPSARDPWVMLERTPNIAMDRVNVGGSQSGQQSNYISRGAAGGNNKWTLDGVDITDMSATGASPIYYDFDMLQEMQVVTGGVDVTQQTGGVGINFVTRGGTDRFRGTGRYYLTDDKFESDNVTDEIRRAGAGSGAPIQNIKDYGFEVGGPIRKGKLWYWGSYGKQDIKAGIVGFYLPSTDCQAIKTAPGNYSTKDIRACLGTDGTKLDNYNWKLQWAPFANNKFAFQNTWAAKTKNARDAGDTRPIETTFRQSAVPGKYGTWGWDVGPSPLYKASDQHVLSDRWLVEAQWAHLGNNFILDFNQDALNDVQPIYNIDTTIWGRSYQRSGPFIRPTDSLDLSTNYFLPGRLGGDHQLKAGYRYRTAGEHSESHVGANTVARFRNGVGVEADLYRDSIVDYKLYTQAFYLQDTYQKQRLTLNLGFRWDRQDNEALSSAVPAHPFLSDWLPAVTFDGATSPVAWNNLSPRLGVTYDLRGDGKTVANASYSIYYGQRSPSQAVGPLNPVTAARVRFPWNDANGDGFVQRNELTLGRGSVLDFAGNYNPDNPSQLTTTGSVDPNLKNDRTREFIVGLSHQIRADFAVSASYIWRKYDQFAWNDTLGLTSGNYVARTYTPPASACPASSRCETVTYYEPTIAIPAPYVYTNRPGYYRNYNGVELTATKRLANRWMMFASYAYNTAVDYYSSPDGYEDPTNIDKLDGAQFAQETSGSGIDNVWVNAKWLVKLQGLYTLPWWNINLSGFYNARQGYPFLQSVLTPSRANRAGTIQVLLDPRGDVRLPSVQTIDFRVEKGFTVGRTKLLPTLDIFNVGNANTILAQRRNQNAANANFISGIVAPRILRFGVRVTW